MDYQSNEQKSVVEKRCKNGYSIIGKSYSRSISGVVILLQKKNHLVAINGLGYDEHVKGFTWNIA